MVEHVGDVHHLIGAHVLENPEEEIPILAALVALAEPADQLDKIGAHQAQMREVVLAENEERIEIGLEVGLAPAPIRLDVILVAVDDGRLGTPVQRQHRNGQGVFGQHVIVIHQAEPAATRHGDR